MMDKKFSILIVIIIVIIIVVVLGSLGSRKRSGVFEPLDSQGQTGFPVPTRAQSSTQVVAANGGQYGASPYNSAFPVPSKNEQTVVPSATADIIRARVPDTRRTFSVGAIY